MCSHPGSYPGRVQLLSQFCEPPKVLGRRHANGNGKGDKHELCRDRQVNVATRNARAGEEIACIVDGGVKKLRAHNDARTNFDGGCYEY